MIVVIVVTTYLVVNGLFICIYYLLAIIVCGWGVVSACARTGVGGSVCRDVALCVGAYVLACVCEVAKPSRYYTNTKSVIIFKTNKCVNLRPTHFGTGKGRKEIRPHLLSLKIPVDSDNI